MILSLHPRLACAIFGLGAWVFALGLIAVAPPVDELDRTVTAHLLGASGPQDIHGDGGYSSPRYRMNLQAPEKPAAPPSIVLCDDDPEEIFQSSPPSPSDQAVILKNLLERENHHLSVVSPLGWEDPDSAALLAMRLQMDRFEGLVLGLPLSYGALSEPVSSPFLKLSIPISQVSGDLALLPVVNRVSIPGAEMGGEKSRAGFTDLLNEAAEPGFIPLLARWGDRIIFALPLAGEIDRRGVDLKEIRIDLGKSILLGRNGLWIDVDARGRIATSKEKDAAPAITIPAASLIGGEIPESFGMALAPMWMVDRRAVVPTEERLRQERLAAADRVIRNSRVTGKPFTYPRPDSLLELAGVLVLALVCGGIFGRMWKLLALPLAVGGVAGAYFGLSWLLRETGLLPLPLTILAVPAASGVARLFLKTRPKQKVPREVAEAVSVPEPVEIPEPIVETALADEQMALSPPESEDPSASASSSLSPAKEPVKKAARKAAKKQAPKSQHKKKPGK